MDLIGHVATNQTFVQTHACKWALWRLRGIWQMPSSPAHILFPDWTRARLFREAAWPLIKDYSDTKSFRLHIIILFLSPNKKLQSFQLLVAFCAAACHRMCEWGYRLRYFFFLCPPVQLRWAYPSPFAALCPLGHKAELSSCTFLHYSDCLTTL